jgi:excisionase family DNA binding protein
MGTAAAQPVRAGYTVAEVADSLHVSRGTVYSLLRAGQLDSFRIGRARRIIPESVTRLVAARATAGLGLSTDVSQRTHPTNTPQSADQGDLGGISRPTT